jgi:tetratricopeptide (TPR) repeat protein
MPELKAHKPAASDLATDNAGRSESGAAIVVAVLAALVVLGLLVGGIVVGFVFYFGRARQLEEEQVRMAALGRLEQVHADAVARDAAQAIAAIEAAERANELAEANMTIPELAEIPLPVGVQPPQPPGPTPEERFQSVIEPLNQAVLERPEDPQAWLDRGLAFHRWRKWKESAEDFEKFLEFNPGRVWTRLDAAVARLANGDREAYLAHCKVVEERLATKTEPTVEHNRAARVLSLAPGALTQAEFLLVMAQREPEKNPGKWWLLEPMLALQYRTGRYDDAAKTIDEVRPLAGFSGQRAATEIWAAMTYHQLGRHEEARAALAAAEEQAAMLPPPGGTNGGGDAIIISLYMLDEARALLAGSAPPNEPPSEPEPPPSP